MYIVQNVFIYILKKKEKRQNSKKEGRRIKKLKIEAIIIKK
jgi:hypothetical protein